ncbi:leupaxin-like [Macrosteles quadrilineatus]|uniref:leupaxin-like n=1 Tax=Macrosteles quadrilineatus TaxID=74068 RepID=UPI0023E1E44C|nr:leupaxin-like [Macrosteles quadrilineatus]
MATEQRSDIYQASDVLEICSLCKKPITDTVLAAMGRTWHVDHFTCVKCGASIRESGFYVVAGKPHCADDYKRLYGKKCSACNQLIDKTIYTALDRHWHPSCFVCRRCSNPISTKEFVEKRGIPYCIDCSRR